MSSSPSNILAGGGPSPDPLSGSPDTAPVQAEAAPTTSPATAPVAAAVQAPAPGLWKRVLTGALMGLANGGAAGALIGGVEGTSKGQYDKMVHGAERQQQLADTRLQQKQADVKATQAEGIWRSASAAGQAKDNLLKDKVIQNYDQKTKDEHDEYEGKLGHYDIEDFNQPEHIFENHGETTDQVLQMIKDKSPDGKVGEQHVRMFTKEIWTWDMAHMAENFAATAKRINEVEIMKNGVQAAQVTANDVRNMKPNERIKALQVADDFLDANVEESKAPGKVIQFQSRINSAEKDPAFPPALLEKMKDAHDQQQKIADGAERRKLREIAAAADVKKQSSMAGSEVVAHMPDGRRVQMTAGDAEDQGIPTNQMTKLTSGQAQANRDKAANFDTAVQVLKDYGQSFKESATQMTDKDRQALMVLTAEERTAHGLNIAGEVGGGFEAVIDALTGHPLTGYSGKLMAGAVTKDQYDQLSKAGQKQLVQYYNTIISNFATMKERLNTVGRSEVLLRAEIHTVPLPYVPWESAKEMFSTRYKEMQVRHKSLPVIQ